ncbi:MAG: cytochrome c4 [Steroidobacteraceae bacterium]|nr:cytochrome c4 [Steroidobacteraceae bacterium]
MIESRFFVKAAAAVFALAAGMPFAFAVDPVVGSPEAGAKIALSCQACHGEKGNSTVPAQPNLAGQNAAYLREQLALFKAKKRNNPVMQSFVDPLSEQDFADVSAYYAAQTPAGLEADPSFWKAGEALYTSGDATRQIPACTACHGPAAQGNPGSGYPALRAQHSTYTVKQLQDYLTQNRYRDSTDPAKVNTTANSVMMSTIASRLSPEDIRNLASYLQGLR